MVKYLIIVIYDHFKQLNFIFLNIYNVFYKGLNFNNKYIDAE